MNQEQLDCWHRLGFMFSFNGLLFSKDADKAYYEVDNCLYEVLPDEPSGHIVPLFIMHFLKVEA